ncbi:M10 family metallopeptidase C-terminal domain-containing protein [Sphingosinicella sp. YJ22]|uniref:M10 family metallopeptidase C-terminal domain-containing protein n=1 Tax=Sphingosinicella sp. YJ22 TaxID=1104780 RepID=UPI00140C6DD5|nr:M10 family metallopeptidase C-terminal domain-containing protein [Sphingosinicella sp. YJ22]
MCRICAGRDAATIDSFYKPLYGLTPDGVGDLKPPVTPELLITTDNVPDAPDTVGNSNPTITVTGPGVTTPIISTIDTIGDQDFYQVTLTAGVTYEIGLYSFNGGPNAVGLTDPYLELYGADGTTFIVSADGGANTPYNELNSGFDVLLTYTPEVSGTFYVNARAFSNSPATSTGDSVGDYELFVREQDPNDPNIYTPYYDVDSPLYAIDWGTQVNRVNQSVRNPDGDEGTRDTGNDPGTPTYTSLIDIPALAEAQGKDITGKNVITIYFAKPGDVFVSNDPTNPGLPPATITAVAIQEFEYNAVWTALGEFEKVADVVYLEVQDRSQADFMYTSYIGTPGPGVSLLGSMSPPDESDEGLAQFNSGDERWNARDLAQGGFSFVTLIHEFGHGHGLAHPHDNGGRSGIMNGVEQETATSVANYTTGDFELNQGVFTMMSYEDGWQSSPYGNAPTNVGYGYLGGLMAFDIAAIQDKYGVNEDWATGNDTYVMKDVNAAGTYFSSIWDGGGTDQIVYNGARNATIDLRAATLQYEVGGGGRVSFANGIHGGYTIANGVTIENATSGAGNDTLIGNDAGNSLRGNGGNDHLVGNGGNDFLDGGAGIDRMEGGLGNDRYFVDAGDTIVELDGEGIDVASARTNYALGLGVSIELLSTADYRLTDRIDLTGNELNNQLVGNNGVNHLRGGAGMDTLKGLEGNDTLDGGTGTDRLEGGLGNDIYYVDGGDVVVELAGQGLDYVWARTSYTLTAGAEVEVLGTADYRLTEALDLTGNEFTNSMTGNNGANTLRGMGGSDNIKGLDGNDVLDGGAGLDLLTGGAGADTFRYASTSDSVLGAADRIQDFLSGVDKIDLSAIDAVAGTTVNDAFSFIGNAAFSGTAGQLRYEVVGGIGNLYGDTNGDGLADLHIVVTNGAPIVTSDFML